MPSKYQKKKDTGFTLVELLVAMALSLMLAVAAVSALVLARQGFFSTDASADLRDNGRFAATILRRITVQSGFLDNEYAIGKGALSLFNTGETDVDPSVKGFNNAKYTNNLAEGTSSPSSTGVINGSDILVIRFQANRAYLNDPSAATTSTVVDETMVDCGGDSVIAPKNPKDMTINAFYVKNSDTTGEPALYCSRQKVNVSTGLKEWLDPLPLVEGVETFQVLYGVDNVTPGAAPSGGADSLDSAPERYLRADQLTVASDATATNKNWERVRSVRIGMVLRSRPGTNAPRDQDNDLNKLYPLGKAFVSDSDTGTTIEASGDGRFRQVVNFTVHLRNSAL